MEDTVTERQLNILRHLLADRVVSRQQLMNSVADVSRITVIRDLNLLKSKGLVKVVGQGPATVYRLTEAAKKLKLYNPAVYFSQDPDSRQVQFRNFVAENLDFLKTAYQLRQLRQIRQLADDYRRRSGSPVAGRERQRFMIEFSWKSSRIEGNTYSLLETEQLIKDNQPASGRSRQEATMILNHRLALDYVWQHRKNYNLLSRGAIEEIHQLLIQDLGIRRGLRQSAVGITGTTYRPPASQIEIQSHLDRIIKMVNDCREVIVAALIALVGISYLQPFVDGNKRTARLVANALLLAGQYPPVSYRTVDENNFKGSLILFYEQAATGYISELFFQQFRFAAKNYNL